MSLDPRLYLVSTPIGNMKDITLRAIEALRSCDLIYCEDTRISSKLLAKLDIKKRLKIYNEHSTDKIREEILSYVLDGNSVCLISDAGTPLISDPGYKLTQLLQKHNVVIDVCPGPCSAVAALSVSTLPTNNFYFLGFFPKTENEKRKILTNCIQIKTSLIFFESAKRLMKTLEIIEKIFPSAKIAVVRELTKLHQQVKVATANELLEFYRKEGVKGEITIIIDSRESKTADKNIDHILISEAQKYLELGLSRKSITELLYKQFADRCKKSYIYSVINSNINT